MRPCRGFWRPTLRLWLPFQRALLRFIDFLAAHFFGDFPAIRNSFRFARRCTEVEPHMRFDKVELHALAVAIHDIEIVLRRGIALFSEWLPLPQGRRIVITLIGFQATLKIRVCRLADQDAYHGGQGDHEALHGVNVGDKSGNEQPSG